MKLGAKVSIPLLSATLAISVPGASADDTGDDRAQQEGRRNGLTNTPETSEQATTSARPTHLVASQIIGKRVRGPQGEPVGRINDVVIDPDTGVIRYAVLRRGAVIGVGGTLHAVAWSALEPVDEEQMVLHIPVDAIDAADGFGDDWPDEPNPKFAAAEGLAPRATAAAPAVTPTLVEPAARPLERAHLWVHRLSALSSLPVRRGEISLGVMQDLVVDCVAGRIAYAVVAYGGPVGAGERRVAAPWSVIELDREQGAAQVRADRQTLDQMAFEEDAYPDFADLQWARSTHRAFGTEQPPEVFGYTIDVDGE